MRDLVKVEVATLDRGDKAILEIGGEPDDLSKILKNARQIFHILTDRFDEYRHVVSLQGVQTKVPRHIILWRRQ